MSLTADIDTRFQIDVRDASDVQTAYAFSLATGVHLSIKNSGHDYKGRSSGRDTLGLWVGFTIAGIQHGPNLYSSIRCTTVNQYGDFLWKSSAIKYIVIDQSFHGICARRLQVFDFV